MRLLKQAMAVLGTVVVIAVMAALIAPKAARAAVATLVFVTNTADAQPFAIRLDLAVSGNFASGTFVVPTGKKLVIDYISSNASLPAGDSISFDVGTLVNGNGVESHLPMVPVGTIIGESAFAMSSPVRIYADDGSTVTISILTSGTDGGGLIVGVYGHLV